MDQILPSAKARKALEERIARLEEEGILSPGREGIMLGALVARPKGGGEVVSYAFSGALDGRLLVDGFVPPCFSVHAFEKIVERYDAQIHCYSDRIERGERELEPVRRALSNEALEEIRATYIFHSPFGKFTFASAGLDNPPTGMGDCAAAKLLNNCLRRGWEPLSLCEMWYGESTGGRISGHVYNPCDEKCRPLFRHFFALDLIYGDEAIVVVDKESGMLSVPGKGPEKADCVTSRLRATFPSIPTLPSVHRLDMDTSGVLVLAKTEEAKRCLSMQFEHRETDKRYVALLEGLVKEEEGIIDLPMRLDTEDRPRQIVDWDNGKRAVTEWRRLGVEMRGDRVLTRVAFHPLTGRTHQLRLHAAKALHPIVGDRLYGRQLPGERLCLHAESLTIKHPMTGEAMTFTATVPF